MRFDKTYVFIVLSSVALALLLVIQFNWLFETAKVKEQLFNEKANMVLARTAEELCSDKETCMNMGSCCMDAAEGCAVKLGRHEVSKIDSLLKRFMNFYNLHIDYSFEVIQPGVVTQDPASSGLSNNIYKKRLEQVANVNGLELKLTLPAKKTFIIGEMGVLFISSIALIIIVFVLFIRTVRSLLREKKLSEHTNEFLNNMTHEFKTPLTNIALAGKGIRREAATEKMKNYTDIILQENEKLKMQVEQVLGMTALERGEIPINVAVLDAHELLRESLKCMHLQVENKGGTIEMKLEAARYIVEADKMHLSSALCNLIDNAIKYAQDGPVIKIETVNSDHKLVIRVEDRGPGIDKAYQSKIFEKFFRVPTGNIHDVKGFGLGLAYVKKIIELHRGTIDLWSEKGKGATFTITLPLADE